MIFIDTSAFFALADRADNNHRIAKATISRLIKDKEEIFTHNYIIVETVALMQRRLGMESTTFFLRDMEHLPTIWIDKSVHSHAEHTFVTGKNSNVSFVDHISFVVMRRLGVTHVFAFDADFEKAGFTCL